MALACPNESCFRSRAGPRIVRDGYFYRSSDRRFITRLRCRHCGCRFSLATGSPAFGQKKRTVNEPLRGLLCSGVSMRRSARLLGIHRITVARKLRFLAAQARADTARQLAALPVLGAIQFDELETFEHARAKPLSVAIAVEPARRKILGFEVAVMPACGPLAARSRRRYGPRPDQRRHALGALLAHLRPLAHERARLHSDRNPRYPPLLHRLWPHARHETVAGLRGCATGQGELKRAAFDPLFALNHTFAMLRANLCRLIRRTWCTTKKAEALADHIALYAHYHNTRLT